MKKILVLLTVLVLMASSAAGVKTYGNFLDVIFLKNYDGDTVTFDIPYLPAVIGEKISIRVAGIDTPELKGDCYEEKYKAIKAKIYVHDILSTSKRIDLLDIKRGKYFRLVAKVKTDQGDLANLLIKEGHAVIYDGKTKLKDWCE